MIPQEFEYAAPKTVDEVLGLLAKGAKPLAGGMSLIPMMKLRLATPDQVVDLGRVKELSYIKEQGGSLAIAIWDVARWQKRQQNSSRQRQSRWTEGLKRSRNSSFRRC